MFVLAVAVGVAIGITLGALGGGGSILTVPALVYLLGQDAHSATTASLVIVGATALAGSVAHFRGGQVRVAEGLVFGAIGVAGSVLGSWLSSGLSSSVLLTGFSVVMLGAAAAMTLRTRRPVPAVAGAVKVTPAAVPGLTRAQRHPAALVATASAVGLLTGFFGVGGGFVVVPALVLVMGYDMAAAVGTSLLVIAVNSGAAFVTRLGSSVHVDWALVGVLALGAAAASVLGARLARVIAPRLMTRAFAALLVVVALYTMARSLPHL